MYAHIDVAAERRLIEASDNPREILDWISEYRQHGLAAAADEDSSSEQQFDDLIEFAMDQVVELKAAPAAGGFARSCRRQRAGGRAARGGQAATAALCRRRARGLT